MNTHICAWCGRKCNNGWYGDSFIAHLPIIDDFSKAFCSRRCRSAFRNQKQREKNQKEKVSQPEKLHKPRSERSTYTEEIILPIEEFKPKTKEDIDLEFYERQKELEFEQQKDILTQQQIDHIVQQRQAKYGSAKEYIKNGGNKYFYVLKMLWAYLDKPWKKILFVLVTWWFIESLLSPLFKK